MIRTDLKVVGPFKKLEGPTNLKIFGIGSFEKLEGPLEKLAGPVKELAGPFKKS